MPDPAANSKYPHTSAFIAYLAKEYPGNGQQQPSPTEADGDSGGENSNTNQEVVKKVVRLLEEEDEDGLKRLVKETYSLDEADPALLEQVILDLMHKHKDDVQGVPFVFLAPMKRPISRPSSRASMHSLRGNRPDTPNSPLARSISLRRPHTPVASPLSASLHAPGVIGNGYPGPSPGSSPTIAHMAPVGTPTGGGIPLHLAPGSQPSSPIMSPHFLNAKAMEFRPSARPGSAMSGSFGAPGAGRNETPSPDLWAHRPNDIIPNSPRRVSGNLAIASPLGNEGYYPRVGTSLTRSNSGLRKSIPADLNDDDDDEIDLSRRIYSRIDDEKDFSPFSKVSSMNMPRSTAGTHLDQFEDVSSGPFSFTGHLPSSLMQDEPESFGIDPATDPFYVGQPYDPNGTAGDDMTPFEVLHSVFGSTVPPAILEEALNKNGFDFESTMAWLVENAQNPQSNGNGQPQTPITAAQKLGAASQTVAGSGGRVATASRDILPIMRGAGITQTTQGASANPQHFGQRLAVATGGRVCRYYLAGECRRSDCRFSHDVERALCRFWLRGQCMKGEQCEFLHTLPQDIDLLPLQSAMAGSTLNDRPPEREPQPADAFPSLSESTRLTGPGGVGRGLDPSRTRFANAVKRQPMVTVAQTQNAAARAGSTQLGVRRVPAGDRSSPATPRPSPRLKLRPPSLLPTLPTGKVVNDLYMSYRAKAIELGGARNVALSRAAEAWKRGDGASAKAFSRQAQELNERMRKETADAAQKLVKERARIGLEAVAARDTSWSDDPTDRSTRGKMGGGGLGVMLGVASDRVGGIGASGGKLTSQERTEVLLDLHGLHSYEGVEVLERFLLDLEKEHFLGLAYIVVGEEKHTGTQDPNRGASKHRLAAGVKEFLHEWQYPWNERDGIVCIDPLTHASNIS